MSAPESTPARRPWLGLLLLKAVVAALLVWLLLRRVPLADAWGRLRDANIALVALFSPLFLLQMALLAWRWQLLTGGLVRYGAALKYTWIGLFYGAVLPGGVSGDIAKGAALALKDQETRAASLPVSILLDRLTGMWSLLVLAGLSCAWLAAGTMLAIPAPAMNVLALGAIGCLVGVAAGAFAVTAAGRALVRWSLGRLPVGALAAKRASLLTALDSLTSNRRRLLLAVLLSFATHSLSVALYVVTLHAVGLAAPVLPVVALYAVTSVIVMVPLTISGVGLRDWFAVLFFEALGWATEAGLAFTWLSLLCGFAYAGIGGFVQLWELFLSRRSKSS